MAIDRPFPFDPGETNPFVEFINRIARKLDPKAVHQDIMPDYGFGMPIVWLFKSWLDDLTGGDEWARFALVEGGVSLADIPDELRPGEPKSAEITLKRSKWLVEQIPPHLREREEQRRKDGEIGALRLEDLV